MKSRLPEDDSRIQSSISSSKIKLDRKFSKIENRISKTLVKTRSRMILARR